jgi:hypothetical protein
MVPDQPGGKMFMRTPISTEKMLDVVVCTCHPNHGGKCKIGGSQSRQAWGKKNKDPS